MTTLRLTPFAGMIIGALVSLSLLSPIAWYIDDRLTRGLYEEERAQILTEAAKLRSEVEGNLTLALSLTRGLEAPYAINGELSPKEFALLARELIFELPYVRNIGVTEGTIFKYVYPLHKNATLIGQDFKDLKEQWPAVKAAIENRMTILAGPLPLLQGGTGLIQRTPVFRKKGGVNGEFLGLVSIVINIDKLLAPVNATNLRVAFRKSTTIDGTGAVFWGDPNLFNEDMDPVITTVKLPSDVWIMSVVPGELWGSRVTDQLSQTHAIIYGLLVLALLAFTAAGYYEATRRQLDQAFQKGQAKYLGLLENAPDAMIFLDTGGNIFEANHKAHELLDYRERTLEGLPFETFVSGFGPETDKNIWQDLISRLQTTSLLEGEEIKVRSGSGVLRDTEISMGYSGTNEDRHITVILRDVTEKRELQYQRNLAEEMLHEAIDTIPDGFAIYDSNDRLFLFNEAYLKIYIESAEAIKTGATFRDIINYGVERDQYPEAGKSQLDREKWMDKRLHSHRNPPTEAIVQKTASGRWLKITERLTATGLIVGVRTDITDVKRTADELVKKRDLLESQAAELRALAKEYLDAKVKAEAATQAKSEFLAIISHELRTPMTSILGISDLLLSSVLSDPQKKQVSQLRLSATDLLGLLNDILDFSKFEAGKFDLEIVNFDLKHIVNSVTDLIDPAADAKGVDVTSLFVPDTPDILLKGDGNRLRQIILNLTSNAIKFTEQGQVTIEVKTQALETDMMQVEILVRDTGIGITPEQQEALFTPFTQADNSTTRKYGGTGLGLSICKKLVEAMNGTISVNSAKGEGSAFTVHLELPKGDIDTALISSPKAKGLERTSKVTGLNILLAEDVAVNRMIVSTVLTKWGHHVEEAVNGLDAVERASGDNVFDLILMDMQMPEMDGCDAAIAIRGKECNNRNVPIIALTADIRADQNERYAEAGLKVFLSKPVDWDQLEKAIEQYCS